MNHQKQHWKYSKSRKRGEEQVDKYPFSLFYNPFFAFLPNFFDHFSLLPNIFPLSLNLI